MAVWAIAFYCPYFRAVPLTCWDMREIRSSDPGPFGHSCRFVVCDTRIVVRRAATTSILIPSIAPHWLAMLSVSLPIFATRDLLSVLVSMSSGGLQVQHAQTMLPLWGWALPLAPLFTFWGDQNPFGYGRAC